MRKYLYIDLFELLDRKGNVYAYHFCEDTQSSLKLNRYCNEDTMRYIKTLKFYSESKGTRKQFELKEFCRNQNLNLPINFSSRTYLSYFNQ